LQPSQKSFPQLHYLSYYPTRAQKVVSEDFTLQSSTVSLLSPLLSMPLPSMLLPCFLMIRN
jgi:hypothetical protein